MAGVATAIPGFALINISVDFSIQLRISHEYQVMNGNNGFYTVSVYVKGDFVTQSMVQVNFIKFQSSAQPVTSPD
jgi:hypothetical protein